MTIAQTLDLPPGTLVYTGEETTRDINLTVVGYSNEFLQQREVTEEDFPQVHLWYFPIPVKDGGHSVMWLDLNGIHKVEILKQMGALFGLHALLLEDILNIEQRPMIQDFESYVFVCLKSLRYNEARHEVQVEQLSFVLGEDFLLSFQQQQDPVFDRVRERISNPKNRIRQHRADYLLYTLLDAVVDNYFLVLYKLQKHVERIEQKLIDDPSEKSLSEIYHLKKTLIFLRGLVWPVRDIINMLHNQRSHLVNESTMVYLRDLKDHTTQTIETITTLQDRLSAILHAHISNLNNKTNEVMKVLTVISTIFIPLNFISTIYGMNFQYMPELHWKWGYPVVMSLAPLIVLSMMVYFKKKKWL